MCCCRGPWLQRQRVCGRCHQDREVLPGVEGHRRHLQPGHLHQRLPVHPHQRQHRRQRQSLRALAGLRSRLVSKRSRPTTRFAHSRVCSGACIGLAGVTGLARASPGLQEDDNLSSPISPLLINIKISVHIGIRPVACMASA